MVGPPRGPRLGGPHPSTNRSTSDDNDDPSYNNDCRARVDDKHGPALDHDDGKTIRLLPRRASGSRLEPGHGGELASSWDHFLPRCWQLLRDLDDPG